MIAVVPGQVLLCRMGKPPLPTKVCPVCRRSFTWRKKWERDWANVKYCSKKCAAASKDQPREFSLVEALESLRDEGGRSLRALCNERPTLIVLLRHSGCTFCKQTLADLSRWQESIANAGVNLAIVTMSPTSADVRALADRYGVTRSSCFADPDRVLYRALELKRGRLLQLFGLRVILGGIRAFFEGHGVGRLEGDGFQMPGAFVVHQDKVVRAYRHETAADRPDLGEMACSIAR